MEPPAKQQKLDENSDVQTMSLVWLDDTIKTSEEDTAAQQELRTFDPNLKLFQNDTECENYIRSQSDQSCIILIVNGKLGQQIIPRIQDLPQIIAIYVFCFNIEFHQKWTKDIAKVKDVVIHFHDLMDRLQTNHFHTTSTEVNQPTTNDNQPNSGYYELDHSYIISDICFDYLSHTEANANDKDEFITSYQTEFAGQAQSMANLQVFQESYSPDRAVSWLRKNYFFCHILENMFQSANTRIMYICRLLIRDIQKQVEQHKFTSPVSVYSGQLMSNENIQVLKNSTGKIITMKRFFLATLHRHIAMVFSLDSGDQKPVLFEIEANPQIEGAKAFMKTDVVFDQNDVDEVLFMIGSLFRINEIRDDGNGPIIIKMALCANESQNSIKSQLKMNNKRNDLIGYAQLQYDLSEILKYPERLHYVVELLEKYLNESSEDHPDRNRCYDLLGSITFAMSDWDACLNWSLKSFEIKKKFLQPNDPQLIVCYEYLAYVYLNKNDNTQALNTFKQILTIYKQIVGDEHLNLIQYYLRMIEIYEYEGKFTDVLLCYNQIFNIMLKHYPIDDLNLAPIYSNIGKTWASLSQYPLALGYYQTSLDIKLKHLTTPSDSIALSYKHIGFIYKDMKNIDQAKIHFEKAATMYRELHSSNYETVLEIEQILQNLSFSTQ